MFKSLIKFFLATALILLPTVSFAKTYNPNNILSDNEYLDSSSMSSSYIQEFFRSKGSGLANITVNASGTIRSVADIFFDAAKTYGVSQKLLVATAQKEQSAITCEELTQNQLDKLMGYGIYEGNDYSEYLGVYNQINYAARQFRKYYDYHENYGWQQGKKGRTGDNVEVTPVTKATAGLYNYTPYAGANAGATMDEEGNGGNFLFWQVWNNWFVTRHPSGTLVREDGQVGIYYVQNGKKKPFWSGKVFKEQGFEKKDVVIVSKNEIDAYSTTSPMKYPDGTLLQAPSGGIYAAEGGLKRPITSRQAFDSLGYNTKNIIRATDKELNLYANGDPITVEINDHPDGTLVKSPVNGGIYLLEGNQKKPVRARQIFENRFKWEKIISISKEKFNQYQEGSPVLFKDGTLIRDEAGSIFVIENGKRRHIERPSVFSGLGYNIGNVINTPNWIVLMHPGGEPIKAY